MVIKSFFDKLVAFFGLLFLWQLFILVSIFIKIKMPCGPVLFIQRIVGEVGNLFNFKSKSERHSGSSICIKGENIITQVGAFLRKHKIDELPDLCNVLKRENRKILELLPDITESASLKYSNEEELLAKQKDPIKHNDEVIFTDKVKINLDYYNKSLLANLKIIINTNF